MILRIVVFVLLLLPAQLLARASEIQDLIQAGEVMLDKGWFRNAALKFEKAVSFDSTNAQTHFLLGRALLGSDKTDEGIRVLERAEELGYEKKE